MDYPREYLGFAECLLREHPGDKRELKDLELSIEACCRRPSGYVAAGGRGGDTTEQEIVYAAKQGNQQYQHLTYRINTTEAAIRTLRPRLREYVAMKYWRGISDEEIAEMNGLDARRVRRIKQIILCRIMPYFSNMVRPRGARRATGAALNTKER